MQARKQVRVVARLADAFGFDLFGPIPVSSGGE
jgi:hypothetical protein